MRQLLRRHRKLILLCVAASGATRADAQWYVEVGRDTGLPEYDLAVDLTSPPKGIVVEGRAIIPRGFRHGFSLRDDMRDFALTIVKPVACAGAATLTRLGPDPKLQASEDWKFTPSRPCPADASLSIAFSYHGGAEAGGRGFFAADAGSAFGLGGVSSWYPRFGYDRARGRISFTVPDNIVVKASGIGAPIKSHPNGRTFAFTTNVPSLFDFAAGPYRVVLRRHGAIPITLYLFGPRPRAEAILDAEEANMATLQRQFGPYPFDEFAIVEVAAAPAQKAGFLGVAVQGFFLARSDYLNRAQVDGAYLGHELGHQWFPQLVSPRPDAPDDLMLTEALAHYGALRSVEAAQGPAGAEAFRRKALRDALNLIEAGTDHPLGSMPAGRPSYLLSNTKGVLVWDMLAREVGLASFQRAMVKMNRKRRFQHQSLEDILNEVSKTSRRSLRTFAAEWIWGKGMPVLTLDWKQQKSDLSLLIQQKSASAGVSTKLFHLSLPIQIQFEGGLSEMRVVRLDKPKNRLRLPVPGRVVGVNMDPSRTLAWVTESERQEASAKSFFTVGRNLWDGNNTEGAVAAFRQGLNHLTTPDVYGIEFLLRLHLGWIAQEAGRSDEAESEYQRALGLPHPPPEYKPQLDWNLAQVLLAKGDIPGARAFAAAVIRDEAATGNIGSRTDRARQMIEKLDRAR